MEWSKEKQVCWQRFFIDSVLTFLGGVSRIVEKIAKSVGRISILAQKISSISKPPAFSWKLLLVKGYFKFFYLIPIQL